MLSTNEFGFVHFILNFFIIKIHICNAILGKTQFYLKVLGSCIASDVTKLIQCEYLIFFTLEIYKLF